MTTAFPLLRLPYLVLMPILKEMEFMERIELSLLSQRARMYVRLLKMKCNHITLRLEDNRIEMKVLFDNSEELKVDMYTNRYEVNLRYGKDYISWWPGSLPPTDYVFSIIDVTHCKSIKKLTLDRIYEHDPSPLFAKLPRIDELIVPSINNDYWTNDLVQRKIYLQKVLRTVLPLSSAVSISYHVLNPKYLQEIIKGNHDSVTVRKYSVGYMPNHDMKFSLNDLKMTNVRSLELAGPAFTLETLNRYFKLWMKKKCNSKLEYLGMETNDSVDIDLLLDGLNAVQMPIRTDRTFRVLGNVIQLGLYEKINFEFDITRADGRQATIRISNYTKVCFYVWPESTNDTTNLEPNQYSFIRVFSSLSTFYNSCIERFK